MQIVLDITAPLVAALIIGAVSVILNRLETQGRALAILLDQINPHGGRPLREVVAEHTTQLALITQRLEHERERL